MSTKIHSSSPVSAAAAGRLNTTADDEEDEAYRRGRRDGIVWAADYATANELRGLVASFEPGRVSDVDINHSLRDLMGDKEHMNVFSVPDYDDPFWRGFVAGAEEALDAASPLLNG